MISNAAKLFLPAVFLMMVLPLLASRSFAEDPWIREFEDICSRTDDAGGLGKPELQALIDRCDKLRPEIEKSDNDQKKIYLFRLDKCKRLFIYSIEVAGKNKAS